MSGRRRGRGQRGVALIEMAIVVGLLSLLLFGIITYGVTMSYDQSLTQAANDGARAAAVAPRDLAVGRAEAAVQRVASGLGTPCNAGEGLTCTYVIDPCPEGTGECMTIELTYDLRSHPRVAAPGPVAATLPDQLVATAVVEVGT